ncbi:MAG TPA: lytic transglycosylase domain-containing protein, partial [Telluria sp.]
MSGALVSQNAQAGNQKEEALADSVRLALAHAIQDDGRPPKPVFH